MKRCQKCSRTFPDENQKFCTFDGGLLMADQPTFDPNRTILAPQMDSSPRVSPSAPIPPTPPPPPNAPERDLSETIVAYRPDAAPAAPPAVDATTALTGGQTTPDLVPPVAPPVAATSRDLVLPVPPAQTSADLDVPYAGETIAVMPAPPPPVSTPLPAPPPIVAPPPPPPPVPPTVPEVSAPQPPAPVAKPAKPPKKRSVLKWIVAILIVLFLGAVGLAAAGYVFREQIREFIDKQMSKSGGPTPVNGNSNTNSNGNGNTNSNSANTNGSSNTNSSTSKQPPAFVPPADAVQFTNAKTGLDGDLAAHYVDFSFYYPKTWTKDPKAGVSGASNFAKVDRQFSDSTGDFIQERALFNWYPSSGTYEGDLRGFPEYAKKFTDQLKSLQGYEEVSRGETTVNAYKAYEVRFKGEFKKEEKSLPYWGRVILLPPGTEGEKSGVAIIMLATSYASGVTSAADVGVKGELAMILESFRFASKP